MAYTKSRNVTDIIDIDKKGKQCSKCKNNNSKAMETENQSNMNQYLKKASQCYLHISQADASTIRHVRLNTQFKSGLVDFLVFVSERPSKQTIQFLQIIESHLPADPYFGENSQQVTPRSWPSRS